MNKYKTKYNKKHILKKKNSGEMASMLLHWMLPIMHSLNTWRLDLSETIVRQILKFSSVYL